LQARCSDQQSRRETSDRQNVLNQCFQRTSNDAFGKSRITETAAATKDDYKVHEIGCGAGFATADLTNWLPNAQITAIDTNSDMIESARDHHELTIDRVHFFVESGEQAAEQWPGNFDVVWMRFVVVHVPNPVQIIKAAVDCLKPQGTSFESAAPKFLELGTCTEQELEAARKSLDQVEASDFQLFSIPGGQIFQWWTTKP
jgi:2-polyprenyl-3-methyl-5-hydroxy-6-metoxy-1,4-benzoquinol methylase